ncbi:hypothetical protein Droror1_Dr00008914 [Drosera rotundifolia]
MNKLKQAHAYTLRILSSPDHLKTLFLRALKTQEIAYAHKLFDEIPEQTLFLYNKLIQAYSIQGSYRQCISLYKQMFSRGLAPDHLTFTFVFPVCAALMAWELGMMVHGQFVVSCCKGDVYADTGVVDMYAKMGLLCSARKQFDHMRVRDVATWNSLISGYARGGEMERARELFRLMPVRNVVSWTAMVSGYSQNGQYVDALRLFLKMEESEVRPNEVTVASVLPACANLGVSEIGERIEDYARQNGYLDNVLISNALLEMYAKCGRLDAARVMFDGLGKRRNLCSWNSMIMGLAVHGRYEAALGLFHEMLVSNLCSPSPTMTLRVAYRISWT